VTAEQILRLFVKGFWGKMAKRKYKLNKQLRYHLLEGEI